MKQNTEYVCPDTGDRIAPRYIHTCQCCIFLGTFGNNDLYICNHSKYTTPAASDLKPVIARYGDGNADYVTMPYKYALKNLNINQPLYIAAERYDTLVELNSKLDVS